MAETMTRLEQTPGWMTAICKEIDALVFTSAFDKFTPDAELIFGTESSFGATEMHEFFVKIDSPLISRHEIFEVWSGSGRTYARGQAQLAKKSDPHTKSVNPFQWMFY